MAKTSILQTVWAQRFLYHLDNSLVFAAVCNRNYEGDASRANVVRINNIGAVNVATYVDTSAMTIQPVTSSNQDLTINQFKYFNFKVEDLDRVQSQMNLVDEMSRRAAYAVGNTIDAYLEASVFKGAGYNVGATSGSAYGVSGSALVTTGSGAFDKLVNLGVALDESNAPREDRFVIIPPWYLGEIVKDTRFLTQNPVIQQNGLVVGGLVNGMQVYLSNNLTTYGSGAGKEYNMYAGSSVGATFAMGLREMEAYRPEGYFADGIKGLVAYAGLITLPGAVYQGTVKSA